MPAPGVTFVPTGTAPASSPESSVEGVTCTIEQDASPIRGVAGVLSDATRDMADDEYIIVSNGAQIYLERLDDLVHAMAKKQADVTLVSSRDSSTVGVWLIRVGVLRSIKDLVASFIAGIMIMLDSSGSMDNTPSWGGSDTKGEIAQDALVSLITKVNPLISGTTYEENARFGLFTFRSNGGLLRQSINYANTSGLCRP